MRPRRKRSWPKWVAGLLVVGGIAGGAFWYLRRPKDEAPDFKTAAVTRGDLIQAVTANGQLNAVKSVQVGSQISGIILNLNVDFNSQVKEGDVIAQIDPATYQHGVTMADADLMSAKASLELAEINDRRAQELRKNDLISPSDADKTTADLHSAQATVKMREASLERAKVDLSHTTIYTPISGVVISRNVDVGQTVAASFNTPTLFQIANDLTKMQIDAMVSEADVGGVDVRQKVTFTVDAFPTRQFVGEVRQVRYAPTTNQNVVTYTCVVDVTNPELKLRPGMTANASIITAERPDVLKIPNAALRFRPPEKPGAKGATNAPASRGPSTNQSFQMTSATGPGEATGPRGPGGGGTGPSDEMRRRFESMSPEERAAFRERMRSGGGGGGQGRRRGDGPVTRTVYIVGKETSPAGKEVPVAKPVTIKTGITDGVSTEVLEGLKEGDVVITGLNIPDTAASATAARPQASPFGGPPGGGFRGR